MRMANIASPWKAPDRSGFNRTFPNYLGPNFRSESWCSFFHMQNQFSFTRKLTHFHVNENWFCIWKLILHMKIDLHMKRWAPRLASRKRPEVIRKCPISVAEKPSDVTLFCVPCANKPTVDHSKHHLCFFFRSKPYKIRRYTQMHCAQQCKNIKIE